MDFVANVQDRPMSSAVHIPLVSIPAGIKEIMLNLPRFKSVDVTDLIKMAKLVPGGNKVNVSDRLTAIVLLIGTKKLTDPLFQQPYAA